MNDTIGGGKLLIGVDDAGKPVGVANAKKLLEDIPNKIRDTMGIVADVSLVKRPKKDVIQIVVRESDFPVAYRGEISLPHGIHEAAADGLRSDAVSFPQDASLMGWR